MNQTKWYYIPTYPTHNEESVFPLCLLRFPVGKGSPPGLSLADFGLMASLTYETPERAQPACAHYFPDWRVERRPESARNIDWIRFLMLTSKDNSTTVIAVRGTLDFLDVLQDVAIWLVPALMQFVNLIGPDVSTGPWGQAMSSLSHLVPLSSVRAEHSFSSVLGATELMMRIHPQRLFYLTGHSLGGGVAKLVALKLSHLAGRIFCLYCRYS